MLSHQPCKNHRWSKEWEIMNSNEWYISGYCQQPIARRLSHDIWREIDHGANISTASVLWILIEILQERKDAWKWVPHHLTDGHEANWKMIVELPRLKKENSEEDCHYQWRTEDTIHATEPSNISSSKKWCWQQSWVTMIIMVYDTDGVLVTDIPPSKRFLSILLDTFLAFQTWATFWAHYNLCHLVSFSVWNAAWPDNHI
jgi:hypothetical protein